MRRGILRIALRLLVVMVVLAFITTSVSATLADSPVWPPPSQKHPIPGYQYYLAHSLTNGTVAAGIACRPSSSGPCSSVILKLGETYVNLTGNTPIINTLWNDNDNLRCYHVDITTSQLIRNTTCRSFTTTTTHLVAPSQQNSSASSLMPAVGIIAIVVASGFVVTSKRFHK